MILALEDEARTVRGDHATPAEVEGERAREGCQRLGRSAVVELAGEEAGTPSSAEAITSRGDRAATEADRLATRGPTPVGDRPA